MAGKDNLKPQNTRTKEEQREIARMGGIASGKARRQAKTFKEIGQVLAQAVMRGESHYDIDDIKSIGDMKGANLSVKELMLWQQIQKALEGDTKAFEVVRDTIGEKPIEDVRVENKGAKDKLDEVLEMWEDKRK